LVGEPANGKCDLVQFPQVARPAHIAEELVPIMSLTIEIHPLDEALDCLFMPHLYWHVLRTRKLGWQQVAREIFDLLEQLNDFVLVVSGASSVQQQNCLQVLLKTVHGEPEKIYV
jgi:hypothetical protein